MNDHNMNSVSSRIGKCLVATYLAEKYIVATVEKPDFHSDLLIWRLRQVEDHVRENLAEDISVETLADLAELSPFHFFRVFKHATGMSPLQYVTRERITLAQQLIRETSRSLIEIALEVGYTSPSAFTKVFRRVTGVTPMEFRKTLRGTSRPRPFAARTDKGEQDRARRKACTVGCSAHEKPHYVAGILSARRTSTFVGGGGAELSGRTPLRTAAARKDQRSFVPQDDFWLRRACK